MANEREVTIYDIARELKISATTVSRGLQDHPTISTKTKKKILDLAEQMGYRSNHFARSLRNQKTNTFGIIVPRLNSHFMSSVIAGIETAANEQNFSLLIAQSSESSLKEAASARTMFDSRVDGLLVSLAVDTTELSHFDNFFRKNIPVIFFDRVQQHESSVNILIDNRQAAYNATRHLIEQGCRRILHITAPTVQNVYKDRLKGYKEALSEHKIKFREDYVLITDLSQEAGAEAASKILKMKPIPDGIFVANDSCAVGCMLALKEQGIRIPQDIAFVGFNNDPVTKVIAPNLTTINYSGYEMGQVAARHLINHVRDVSFISSTNTIILRSELIVRASSLKKGSK
ncbi:LacI family DNA-binding transcriptional regulator [Chitinophaga pinensis]|uniref:Transcriptional regulator, LacI family n=1 Tax=Chitinophaga pinensis (strain ATCC 43595 / DSM 2588 / LMG 13176 / NBRC 15968 / NCIMB 11800 / UQM 2034) TaxID=485918 RepID=A0A979G7Q2_CHIPD|nr:LacI family DNA-binding transcriptional regulator [Chitinophaga pinensis]ACU62278.1 transcriptional regulator, LacI family [Chitinophaga pinensis DSM 2588]